MSTLDIPIDRSGSRTIAPTDISQFIRLNQCQRYLRLRLHQRKSGGRFVDDYGVTYQRLPVLLTEVGSDFEERIETAIQAAGMAVHDMREPEAGTWTSNNDLLVEIARSLPPGDVTVLLQTRLLVDLSGWLVRGDVDLLRLERDLHGNLHAVVADIKSSKIDKLEHRLQVTFYLEMLNELFNTAGIEVASIQMGILYRGSPHGDLGMTAEEREEWLALRDRCFKFFGTRDGLFDIIDDADIYRDSVHDLVTGSDSVANQIAATEFEQVPFQLNYKCDFCTYNQLCLKWAAEQDDLSVLPFLTQIDKGALQRSGIQHTRTLANLKVRENGASGNNHQLTPAPGSEDLNRRLASTWPIGARIDELIHRAQRYRAWRGDSGYNSPGYIPGRGYGSIPYVAADHDPNMIFIYIDAQNDYLHDRIYLAGAKIVACERGAPARSQSIVEMTAGPPEHADQEKQLLVSWIDRTLQAVIDLATPDEDGNPRAPIHLIFYSQFEQQKLLDGLARHFESVLGATPLYDFITQMASFDSPVATFLDQEIRDHKNYPIICQSLYSVSAFLGFDWQEPEPFRQLFRQNIFDFWMKLDEDESDSMEERPWYVGRSRFNSQIPLEYAYAAWGVQATSEAMRSAMSIDLINQFHKRRLDALEHIAGNFYGNRDSNKSYFVLPDLGSFEEKAASLAQALDEFVMIERHVEMSNWKTARRATPERRVLSGDALLVQYSETDQDRETIERNREHLQRWEHRTQYQQTYLKQHPGAPKAELTKEQKDATKIDQEGMVVKLRIATSELDGDLDDLLAISGLKEGSPIVISPRWTVDERLLAENQTPMTPTAKQILYRQRGFLQRIRVERDVSGKAIRVLVEVELVNRYGVRGSHGFIFGGSFTQPFRDHELFAIDPDPNSWTGFWSSKVTEGLRNGGRNTLYRTLTGELPDRINWPEPAAAGQRQFLEGLFALQNSGDFHPLEPSKQRYIGDHGSDRILLVQGPPGTGKSYATSFAIFARIQGALAAGLPFRVFISCRTHAAVDVLLENIRRTRARLLDWSQHHPELFDRYFDRRLLSIPLFRLKPPDQVADGVIALNGSNKETGEHRMYDYIEEEDYCLVAGTPGRIYGAITEKWNTKRLFGHEFCDLLVLDEASQMNLPEAIMAALPLQENGQLFVVGDHRQMPPIVQHDWSSESRRTFHEFLAYQSLFLCLLDEMEPQIKFAESFRLHSDMAGFLGREIYKQDNIDFHSNQREVLAAFQYPDPFVASVLQPDHPLIVIVHDEEQSQVRNTFERDLIAPVLEILANEDYFGLGPQRGLGVVVPHRAQRAELQDALPELSLIDSDTGAITLSAVDTVERFQGDERTVIVVSATESDPGYLLQTGRFLYDPRRLTVALSRAKQKMVLVASRSVFNLFSTDEEIFTNSLLWKHLLRRTCTVKLWDGARDGHYVQVWGNSHEPGE